MNKKRMSRINRRSLSLDNTLFGVLFPITSGYLIWWSMLLNIQNKIQMDETMFEAQVWLLLLLIIFIETVIINAVASNMYKKYKKLNQTGL